MTHNLASVDLEYIKDKELKKNDIKALLEWASKQPHLPKMNELQAILFLQSCYYRNEAAKVAIDNYFTFKTHCSDMYGSRNPYALPLKDSMNLALYTALPKKTPEGYTIIFIKLVDPDASKFTCVDQIRCFDMICLLNLYLEGTSKGHLVVYDMKGLSFGHLTRIGPFVLKKLLYYVQEALPLRLKGVHFVNPVFFADKFMGLLKPFMKKELADIVSFHRTVNDLDRVIPRDCLPKDYGGSADEISALHGI